MASFQDIKHNIYKWYTCSSEALSSSLYYSNTLMCIDLGIVLSGTTESVWQILEQNKRAYEVVLPDTRQIMCLIWKSISMVQLALDISILMANENPKKKKRKIENYITIYNRKK